MLHRRRQCCRDHNGQHVVLEGQIEPGDYDKLRDFLLVKRDYEEGDRCPAIYDDSSLCPEQIYLASPGGDVAEAMKIGRLVRALGWDAVVPTRTDNTPTGSSRRENEIKRHHLGDAEANFMCASACFFIFVGAISKDTDVLTSVFGPPIIGVHRPYVPTERLKELSGGQAIATANLTRVTVEGYLKEMDVQTKYIDQMFSVPKDKVLWIGEDDFDNDFRGLVPSLREWVEAKCNNLTDIEKTAWESIKNKLSNRRTQTENSVADQIAKKFDEQARCEIKLQFELRKDAWQRWRKEALQKVADICAARKGKLPAELATALSAAVPNQQSAGAALTLAQTAGLCRAYGLRENAIRLLATRGDAKAQRILGNLFTFGGSTIAKDRLEGMAWYGRAGAQGDLFAQNFYRDLSGPSSVTNHHWTDKENFETGLWISRNCPALC